MNAFDAADAAGRRDELQPSSRSCSRRRTERRPDATTIPATYLRVTVSV